MSKQIHVHIHRSSAKDAAPFRRPPFGIDDIAIGGTVIYKNGAKWEMSKAQSKSGMRVKLTNGKEIHVGDIWSTDASDWNAFKAATADARSKAEIENDLDDVQEEIEKLEDRGQTVPAALRQKREKLQAEYKAAGNAVNADFKKWRTSKDANPDAQKAMMALVQGLRRLQTEAKGNQAKFKSYGDMAASDAFYRVLTQINGAVSQAESDTTRI